MFYYKQRKNRGFTLIELLVVVAIISLLSSVVLASLNSARAKGRDAAIKTSVLQLRTLIQSDYDSAHAITTLNGTYSAFVNAWYSSIPGVAPLTGSASCLTAFPNAVDIVTARNLCTSITNNSSAGNAASNVVDAGGTLWIGRNGDPDTTQKYTIMAYLPGKQTYFCVGSSGKVSDIGAPINWTQPGCYGGN